MKMKINLLAMVVVAAVVFTTQSCSSDDSSSQTTTTTSTTITTPTSINLTAITTSGELKANYILMLFDEPVSTSSALPPILKQVTTNSQGLGVLDLESLTTATPKTFYVEAFEMEGQNYVLKSVIHRDFEVTKGSKITSTIIVN